jgi:hypothetical protein
MTRLVIPDLASVAALDRLDDEVMTQERAE